MLLYVLIIALALLVAWLHKLNRDYCVMAFFAKRLKTVDGTSLESVVPQAKAETIFANVFDCFGANNVVLFESCRIAAANLKKSYVEYALFTTFYNVITAEDAELLLSDKNIITKGIAYYFLEPFLHTGLLTSTGKKWHTRRKMLTSAFHFNILDQFEEVFKEESQKFVDQLKSLDKSAVTLNEIIPKFTLNSVCDAALGVKLDEQLDDQQYRASFKMIEEAFIARISNPFYMIDIIYNIFMAPKMEKHLRTVHEFSSNIIHKRRQLFAAKLEHSPIKQEQEGHFNKRKRYAMLDTLLHAERDSLIDHAGICEEVDTFMFEGFDTTSMALIFTLMNLSLYQEMQAKCYQEIMEYVEDDLQKLDVSVLGKLKYLECFIKETLRLYPSVPGIMRKVMQDTSLANNVFLPAGTEISIHIFDIQRDPKYFPEPNKFDPRRFTPENSEGRHPYAYIPFSAGQRNCIVFPFYRKLAATMKRSYLQYGFFMPFYNIITADEAEIVMSDQKSFMTKGLVYNFLVPILNRGLLTSSGQRWHARRKMLTPTFHFNILGQFVEIFKEESKKFAESLEVGNLNSITLNEIIPRFTLNTVCETALGVKLDEQMNADQYRASFKMIEEVFVARIVNPFYMVDSIYKLFLAPKIKKHISIVHNFSSEIIDKRRQLLSAELEQQPGSVEAEDANCSFSIKKRYAMLDTLLRAERDGLIDHTGICEEVDTFMFEGFDTTSMALIFSLMNFSLYPEMQQRCYQEIHEYVDDDISKLDINQLAKLKYMEYFIKEILRIYPSVPAITRVATSETSLPNNLILPKGTQVVIHIIDIHHNTKYYENPNTFDPERFTTERSADRHPFAFVPFSAGIRNCIGQKFAMLEIKTLLVYILKKFKVLPLMDAKDVTLGAGMIIRTLNNVKVKLEKRV